MSLLSSCHTHRLGQPGVELTGIQDDVYKIQQILPFASEVSKLYSPFTIA